MKVRVMQWLEPFEVDSDEAALACLAALAVDVATGSGRTVDAIGFAARREGDFLEIQPMDRAGHAEALEALGAVQIAEQLRKTPMGLVPLVNCGAFTGPRVIFLTPSVISPGGDA